MAALNVANIPNGISSYEELFVWAAMCCQHIANGAQVTVTPGLTLPQCLVSTVKTSDNIDRYQVVAYLQVVPEDIASPTLKPWKATRPIAATAPHTNFLSN